jgi:diguanylate cyclase (GGDEF)-like protein
VTSPRSPIPPPADTLHSVVLLANVTSGLAARLTGQLTWRGIVVEAVDAGVQPASDPDAAIVVFEGTDGLGTLRTTLDRTNVPVLVLVTDPALIPIVLPLLDIAHDWALATEAADAIAWRLQRLIDISRRLRLRPARIDSLTGLLTRDAFLRALTQRIRANKPEDLTGLLFIDLDQFKMINDRLGHVIGDRVLQTIGQSLPRSLARSDAVARLGGDEFACIITRADPDTIVRHSLRLLRCISELDLPELREIPSLPRITASAGLTFVRPDVDLDKLLHEADMAAYQAKSMGRNRLEVFDRLADAAKQSSLDLNLAHFENVTRVATERLVEMITLKSRRLISEAQEKANWCSTTGLYSRDYFNAQMPRELADALAQSRALTVALMDIDGFGRYNKIHGWPTGDRVLRTFGSVARANVRATDWVARFGGDEFIIVMPDTELASAVQVVERVQQSYAATPIESLDGQRLSATISVGLAQRAATPESVETLVNRASEALKANK